LQRGALAEATYCSLVIDHVELPQEYVPHFYYAVYWAVDRVVNCDIRLSGWLAQMDHFNVRLTEKRRQS
jgi:hypothetical protein